MRYCAAIVRYPLLLGLLAFVAWPGEASAQECGRWDRSVLCTVELQASRDRGSWERFDPNDRQTIAPQQSLEIELRGEDQYRREFPRDRLVLAFDDRDCDRMLDVQDRGRGLIEIRATASTGIRTYLNEVQRRSYQQVLMKMIRSGEFEDRLARDSR